MTTIAILGGDWQVDFDDENDGGNAVAGLRQILYVSGPVRTTNEVYSAIADISDDFTAMGFKNPMLPTTPNAYTLENKYFMSRASMEQLKEGAITADWSPGTVQGDAVIAKQYTIVTDFVTADIGKQVTESASTDTGTLLDFEVLPDGTNIAWIRPDDPATDVFDATSGTLSVTGDGGTGTNNVTIAAAVPGTLKVPAIQVIGSVPTASEVYIIQDRIRLTSFDGSFQWWDTDETLALGIISTLVRTTDVTSPTWADLAEGDVEVFARRYTSLYDNFRLNIAAGGFQALPLASGADINNTTGYARVTTDAGSLVPVAGDILREDGAGNENHRMVVTAISGTGPNFTIDFYHTGEILPFLDNDVIEDLAETNTLTLSSGETATPGGPTEAGAGNGGSVTFTLGAAVGNDHDGDGTNESYSVTIDAQGDVSASKVYERMKYETRRGATTDLFAGMNVPGETYRGLEGIFEYDANTNNLVEGDDVTINTRSNFSARLMANVSSPPGSEPQHIALTDIQSSLLSAQPANDDIVWDETAGTNTATIHAGGTVGIQRFTSPKGSPFGTFTGTQIFGARGVLFINPGAGDAQNYILTDNLGNPRNPPNTVTILINNTRAGDRIYLARDTGTAGIINKDQFGGLAAPAAGYNEIGDIQIRMTTAIDSEVPNSGWVRIIETTKQEEHHYVYDSLDLVDEEFNLRTAASFAGTADATTSDTVLEDAASTFVTHNVEVGMLLRVVTGGGAGSFYEVTAVTGETTLGLQLIFGSVGGFTTGSTYEINKLIQTYATTDNAHDLILDVHETVGTDGTPGSESNTLVKVPASDYGAVLNVRNGKNILPFTQNVTIGDSGLTATVVRTPDTIAV